MTKKNCLQNALLFLLFFSIFTLFSNGKTTTSMDIDVLNYAKNFLETGNIGSPYMLSGEQGNVFSNKKDLFYPLEGTGVIAPIVATLSFSKLFSIDSLFPVFLTNQILSALSLMFFFMTLKLFISDKKAILYTLLLGLATPIFVHSKFLMPEPVTMVAFTGAIYYYFKAFKYDSTSKYSLLIAGLLTGFSLLCRPDAAIFYLFFSGLIFIKLFINDKKNLIKRILPYAAGLAVFSIVFAWQNYDRFGSIAEFGYSLDKDTHQNKLKENIAKMDDKIIPIYNKAKKLNETKPNSNETKEAIIHYNKLAQAKASKEKYLNYRIKNFSFVTAEKGNLITTYFQGLYLILLAPNRSILFLSPFFLFLIPGFIYNWKKRKLEVIAFSLIFFAYLSLYALRAPLSYAGSAAWGVRYLLPVYFILGLGFIGLEKSGLLDRKPFLVKLLITLGSISFVFQIIGSAVSYQTIQMPIEFSHKIKSGDANMDWASNSRQQLMTDPSAALLINNLQVISNSIPQSVKANLPQTTIKELIQIKNGEKQLNRDFFSKAIPKAFAKIQNKENITYDDYSKKYIQNFRYILAYSKNSGINDWFFYDLFKGEGRLIAKNMNRNNYKLLFFLLLIAIGSSSYLLCKKDEYTL